MSIDSDATPADSGPGDARELSMTVVEYTGDPDRCTVSPQGLSGVARLSTWLTVDRAVVRDLETMR